VLVKQGISCKLLAGAVLAVALTIPRAAHAAPGPAKPAAAAGEESAADRAKRLRKEGKALLDEGKPARALPFLEEAERLEPGMLSEFRLAECYEKLGRTASAYTFFLKVAKAARAERSQSPDQAKATNLREREEAAKQRAAALEPLLAKLLLSVPPSISGLEGLQITWDKALLARSSWEAGVLVDPGKHTLEASAPGRKAWQTTVVVEAKPGEIRRDVPVLEVAATAPPPSPLQAKVASAGDDKPASGWSTQRKVALGVGGAGVAGVIVGAVAGGLAAAKTGEAKCTNADPPHCDRASYDLRKAAYPLARAADVAFAVGGAALVGGVVLFVTAPSGKAKPKSAARLSVAMSATGFILGGEW